MTSLTGTRTNSIWLSQLLLAVVVVIVVLLVQALAPDTLDQLTFTIGVSVIVIVTGLALALPWHRLPPLAVLAVPMLDILAVGIMTRNTAIDFAFLWVFPVSWIATHFPLWATGTALGTVAALVLFEEAQHPESANGTLRLIIVTLSLTFIAISTQSTSRQTRAFKRLLRREAGKLQETLGRSERQERELSRVLGSIDVGVVRFSATGDLLEANATYHDLYDILPNDPVLVPRSVEYDDYRGSPLPVADRPLARARRGEQFDDLRTWLFTSDGTWRALSLTSSTLPDDRGLASGEALLVTHDITPMVSAEKGRESIAARVSHELRNPLTTILGYSDLLLDDPRTDPKVRERVEAINSGAERMMVLANQILDAGRQGRPVEAPLQSVDLASVAAESIESFTPTAEAGGVTIVFAAAEGVTVRGDAFRLRQIADNLLSNAIKYTPKGGRVIVDVHRAWGADADAPPGADPELTGDRAVLEISDTGMGMEPEDVARIFDPYFRAAAAEASTIVGTGLGMGIVKSLVERHEGVIHVESAFGRGTTVTVDLPSDVCAATASDADAATSGQERTTTDA